MALPSSQISLLSVPPFSTLATGFWIAQLGLNPGPAERLIYHNCAPRQDDSEPRVDNEGEGLTYALLSNGVKVVGVNAGYTLLHQRPCSSPARGKVSREAHSSALVMCSKLLLPLLKKTSASWETRSRAKSRTPH